MTSTRALAGLAFAALWVPGCYQSTVLPLDVGDDTGPPASFDAGQADASPNLDAGPPDPVCRPASTLGQACMVDTDCDDLCFCTGAERCVAGTCAAGPPACDDGLVCTVDACDEDAATCLNEPDDGLCDDGDPCTGVEVCAADLGCVSGAPLSCSDDDRCTTDRCDPTAPDATLACQNLPRDLDGDGFSPLDCGGLDCDDDPLTGEGVNPAAEEVCDDGVDNNCDGVIDVFDVAACPPGNDTCADARLLPGPGTYSFSVAGLRDDFDLSCERRGRQVDAVFTFSVPAGALQIVTLEVSGAPTGSSMELRAGGCEDGPGVERRACVGSTAFGGSALLIEEPLEPGTYSLIVSTSGSGFLDMDLDFSPVPPPDPAERCDAMTPVIAATTSVSGEFGDLADDYPSLPCGDTSMAEVDAAYRLSIAAPRDVVIQANGANTTTGAQRDVRFAVVRDCGDPAGSQVACTNVDRAIPFRTEILRIDDLAAGDYWILIEPDEPFFTVDEYTLDVTITAP